jgi:peptidoglycan/LPS O-acetylase OafA/YrhL
LDRISPGEPQQSNHGRSFVTLDGLRGVAAIVVAARHVPFLWSQTGAPAQWFFESYLAVDFFFVLSGFVLAHAYGDALRNGMPARQFMALRLIRLYPLYFLSLLLALDVAFSQFLHATIGATQFSMDTLFAAAFLPSPFSGDKLFPMNEPAWSLFFELLANLAFCLFAKRFGSRTLGGAVAAAALLMALAVFQGWFGFGSLPGALNAGVTWDTFGAGASRVAFSFFAGVLVYRLWRRFTFPGMNVPSIVVIAPLCIALIAYDPARYRVLFDLVATMIVFPAIVFFGAHSRPGPRLGRAFSWIGGASYGIYVLQAPIFLGPVYILGKIVAEPLTAYRLEALLLLWGVASLTILVGVAVVADKYFDRAARRKLADLTSVSSHRPAAATNVASLQRS